MNRYKEKSVTPILSRVLYDDFSIQVTVACVSNELLFENSKKCNKN